MPDTIRFIGRSPACCVSVRTSHINRGVSAFFTFRLSCGNCGADFTGVLINLGMVGAEESQLLGDITLAVGKRCWLNARYSVTRPKPYFFGFFVA